MKSTVKKLMMVCGPIYWSDYIAFTANVSAGTKIAVSR
jgi:hypothetical protein